MAEKYGENLNVCLPKGTKERLERLAAKRYLTPTSIARVAIMAVLEKASKEETKAA